MHVFIQYLPPFLLWTAVFICGIVWHATNTGIAILLPFTLIGLFLLATTKHAKIKTAIAWMCAAFTLGALRNTLHEYAYLHIKQELCGKKIDIQGTLISASKTNKPDIKLLVIELEAAQEKTIFYTQKPRIQLYSSLTLKENPGDTIVIKGLYLKQPTKDSLVTFFKKQNIMAAGFLGKNHQISVTEKYHPFQSWLHRTRENLLAKFEKLLKPRTFLLVSSIFLGYKSLKTKAVEILYEQFQWWGISHYLARSGLHLVVFVLILQVLFIALPLPHLLRQLVIAGCITTYMLFSWSSVSFMRSLVMIFCYLACAVLQLQQHGLHTISVACFLILIYNPTFLFALDFQLSFGLTLALILLQWAQMLRKKMIPTQGI